MKFISSILLLLITVTGCTRLGLDEKIDSTDRRLMELGLYQSLTEESFSCKKYSQYVTMSDGTKIAVTVALPEGLSGDERIPAIVQFTPYWRDFEMDAELLFPAGTAVDMLFGGVTRDCGNSELHDIAPADEFVNRGYASVLVDVRGTGASHGYWKNLYSDQEVADFSEVIDYIVGESWSDGKVAITGISYPGTAAHLSAATGNSAIKAIVPTFFFWDTYAEQNFPGGIMNDYLIQIWSQIRVMDTGTLPCLKEMEVDCDQVQYIRGPMPVDSDRNRSLIMEAFRIHEELNVKPSQITANAEKNEYLSARDSINEDYPELSSQSGPFLKLSEMNEAAIPAYLVVGWYDGATSDSAIDSMLNYTGARSAIIGPWNHGARYRFDPLMSNPAEKIGSTELLELRERIFGFLDYYVKEDGDADRPYEGIEYYELGSGEWHTTDTWPPEGWTEIIYYAGADNTLTLESPTGETDEDTYTVRFDTGNVHHNRWHTQVGGIKIEYDNRAEEDEKLLVYTTEPLATDLRIHGNVQVRIYAKANVDDWNCFVYLESVDPEGGVHYITEGMLRAAHRHISSETPLYELAPLRPHHSFLETDIADVTTGEVEEYRIGMISTAAQIPAGHSLRLAIAGHDDSTFVRIPVEETPEIQVQRNNIYSTSMHLPVIQ